jgi:GrpB-like predicted nucleotidyltransferase (UPF0157 family)
MDYDPEWKVEFDKIKDYLFSLLCDHIMAIEHVGSTAVVGCAAKPILDIDIVIESTADFESVRKILEDAGYVHKGNQGIEGREVFKRTFEDEFMAYHLYCCTKDSPELLRHLSLRKYLTDHPQEIIRYSELKKGLARRFPYSIEDYIEGKDAFVKQMLTDLRNDGYLMETYGG